MERLPHRIEGSGVRDVALAGIRPSGGNPSRRCPTSARSGHLPYPR